MNTELMSSDDGKFLIGGKIGNSYCSMRAESPEEKKLLFNLTSAPENHLRDMINMEIQLKHVYAEICEFVSKETGDITEGVRMVLITTEGKSYQCASKGVFNCLKRLFQFVGTPETWGEEGVRIRVKQLNRQANRAVLTFELV